ncbi:uncharacterized protein LOC6567044 [Drosophila grimshawi]|uniref:GH13552 n=1 Tax=Drosophila grimshawi TaxID=7222 RepID=B4JPN5_DROGR|nr:uncharacterized protein LOC6567044 [Drosophila grimshawi]EDV98865.1 GH13552 [Drosophila grimshawi]
MFEGKRVLSFLLFLLLHGDGGYSQNASEAWIPERCRYLKESGELMHQQCRGKYPLVAYTKFRDTFMKQTDRMAIFMPASALYVMAALKESELHECDSIQLIEVNKYVCWHGVGGKRTVKLKSAKIFCFPFHVQLPDDLMHECVLDRDGVSDSELEQLVLRTKWGIIHYVFDNDSAMQYWRTQESCILQTILMIALLLLY